MRSSACCRPVGQHRVASLIGSKDGFERICLAQLVRGALVSWLISICPCRSHPRMFNVRLWSGHVPFVLLIISALRTVL
jgi:hypothetical protein